MFPGQGLAARRLLTGEHELASLINMWATCITWTSSPVHITLSTTYAIVFTVRARSLVAA